LSEKSCQKNNKAEPQAFTVYRSNTNVQKHPYINNLQ